MWTEPKTMQELHKIREKIYEEQKDLTIEQKMADNERLLEELEKEYGLHIRRQPPPQILKKAG